MWKKQIKIIFHHREQQQFPFLHLSLSASGPKRVTVTVSIHWGALRRQRHSYLLGLSVLNSEVHMCLCSEQQIKVYSFQKRFFFMRVCVRLLAWVYMHHTHSGSGALGGHKRALDFLELELHFWVTWCGCWELNSGTLQEYSLHTNGWAIFPAPKYILKHNL